MLYLLLFLTKRAINASATTIAMTATIVVVMLLSEDTVLSGAVDDEEIGDCEGSIIVVSSEDSMLPPVA